jgi:hypothetical protein
LRRTYLEEVVEACCAAGNVKKETMVKQIKERERSNGKLPRKLSTFKGR